MKENGMGGMFRMNWREKKCFQDFVENGKWKNSIKRRRSRIENNTKTGAKIIAYEDVELIQFAEDRVQWRAISNEVEEDFVHRLTLG
jgi:hypothetical protein